MDASSTAGTRPGSRPWHQTIAPRVFWPAAALILVFVLFAVVAPGAAQSLLSGAKDAISGWFGWYYTLIVAGFVVFAIVVGMSHFGDISLSPGDEEPEFSTMSWLAMLFAAGMGIGLVFWGVAEPVSHLASPKPGVEGDRADLADAAMTQTLLHWGIHAWAIYVVVGLAVAYATHRKGRPASIRWALEPLLGDRVKGWLGDVIDIAAIVGTLFGVATSLGFGALQIAAGLDVLGVVRNPGSLTSVVVIGLITALAVASVVTGLDRGIKWLSNVNVALAAALLLFVLLVGPTLFLLRETVASLGLYLQQLVRLSFDTTALRGAEGAEWQGAWTAFYWAWWISWAPFVGVFIARISRGRTVRQFVTGVLLVPTVVTILWFGVFGGAALHRELVGGGGLVGEDDTVVPESALFSLLGGLPAASVVTVLAILLVVLFFVTSSDSGSLVVDMLASGGDPDPPTWSRVFWGVAEGLVAVALLLAGAQALAADAAVGALEALRAAAIIIALPFSVIMIAMCFATWRALHAERLSLVRAQHRLQRQELTEHVSQKLVDEGLVEPDGTRSREANR